ncbi:hypothetical protein [Streptomyces olivaceiscleroticus]|uniref:CR-type domain-containing protein n=1 Tax=Streptomyces olivaceiscleroticus TaxID=68245 RepID=A0ABN1A2X4_9ACTN
MDGEGHGTLDDRLTAQRVTEALRQHIAHRRPMPSGEISFSRCSLLECRITRSLETRSEARREHHGDIDLSARPVYTVLSDYPLAPPIDPGKSRRLVLVRRDSVEERLCACGNGTVSCARCTGRGHLTCEPDVPCGECRETTPCRACGGTAQWDRPRAALAAGQEASADCVRCGAVGKACTGCRGRGCTTCPRCKGTAKITCPACQGRGTTEHAACGGQGQTVTWTEGVITRTPATEQLRRPEALPPFVRSVARAAGEWSSAHLNGDEPLPEDLEPGHHKAAETFRTRRPDEVSQRAELRWLPMVRATIPGDRYRVYYAFPTSGDTRLLCRPSPYATTLIAGLLLAVALVSWLVVRLWH